MIKETPSLLNVADNASQYTVSQQIFDVPRVRDVNEQKRTEKTRLLLEYFENKYNILHRDTLFKGDKRFQRYSVLQTYLHKSSS